MQFQLYFFIEVQITSTTKVYGTVQYNFNYIQYTKVHYMIMYEYIYNTIHYICSQCKITCTRKLFSRSLTSRRNSNSRVFKNYSVHVSVHQLIRPSSYLDYK